MKVLFLDIDGVLNSDRSDLAFGGLPDGFMPHDLARFDPVALALVRRLCAETGAAVVLSSSWRLHHTVQEAAAGLGLPVVDSTRDLGSSFGRSDEITLWLATHPEVTHYAIVDDMALHWPNAPHWQHFVRTSAAIGLTASEYFSLHRLLSSVEPIR
jgi:hypothetical protein